MERAHVENKTTTRHYSHAGQPSPARQALLQRQAFPLGILAAAACVCLALLSLAPVSAAAPISSSASASAAAPPPPFTDTPVSTTTIADTTSPAPTLTATFTATASETATPTSVPSALQADTPTAVATQPAATATDTPVSPPSGKQTDTATPNAPATVSVTATPTPPTVTSTPVGSPTIEATPTPTVLATGTISPTPTVTETPTPTLTLSITPVSALVMPGQKVIYTVVLKNADSAPITADLSTTDSDPKTFSSSLADSTLSLPPGKEASTALVVAASATNSGDLSNETVVMVSVRGIGQVRATAKTRLLAVQFQRTLSGMGVSNHNVSPATMVEMQVGIKVPAALSSAVLSDLVPNGWVILDAKGGKVSPADNGAQRIEWTLGGLTAGATVTQTYILSSPPPASPAPQFTFATALRAKEGQLSAEPWPILLLHPLSVTHYRIGWDSPLDSMAWAASTDTSGKGIPRYKAFRVRFRLVNDRPQAVRWAPRLEWSTRPDADFQPVPAGDWKASQPFYVRPLRTIADAAPIPSSLFAMGADTRIAQDGILFTQQNPGPVLTLNPSSYTEIEFSVRATVDAQYTSAYYFRLADDERTMPGPIAEIFTDSTPSVQLTQPQFAGISASAGSERTTLALSAQGIAGQAGLPSPHGAYAATTNTCASCHRSHTAPSRNLLPNDLPQSNLCLSCHDGLGSSLDIKRQFEDASVPADDANTSSFFAHRATAPSTHTQAKEDEFANVLNRHSECSDCHDPHNANSSLAASSATGYTASGALKGVSGVSTASTWKNPITYEYELCYKCHSAYTRLLTYDKLSYQMSDKASQFDPSSVSFHPIEQPGKNNSAQMAGSLAGTSPYKLWSFTTDAVMRCTNCHGDYRLANPDAPPPVAARSAPHTSKYRGLLTNNLQDRVLKPSSGSDNYSAADFALCYQCHAEAPFRDTSGEARSDTSFRFHGFHISSIYNDPGGGGSSTDIDTPGAGRGNAICSECHYQVHGQGTNARGNASGRGLVSFAPNVVASESGLSWDPSARTCSLVCHGKDHRAVPY